MLDGTVQQSMVPPPVHEVERHPPEECCNDEGFGNGNRHSAKVHRESLFDRECDSTEHGHKECYSIVADSELNIVEVLLHIDRLLPSVHHEPKALVRCVNEGRSEEHTSELQS